MSYGLNLPTSGALGWWDTSYDVSAPGGSKVADAAANTTAAPVDSWGGYWQGLLSTVTSYAIAKDAAKSGVVSSGGGQVQPVVIQAPAAQQGIPPVLLLAGLGLLAYMAAKD